VALPAPPGAPRQVRPYVASLLERIPDTAAFVTAATYDVIAWNPLAEALVPAFRDQPNLARRRFLRRAEMTLTSGQEDFGEIAVARLRAAADRHPRDPRLAALLAELRAGSEEFTDIWDTHPVRVPGHRTKTMQHPQAGPLRVNCDVLTVPDDDQQVVFITADPGSPSARKLRRLAAGITAGNIRTGDASAGVPRLLVQVPRVPHSIDPGFTSTDFNNYRGTQTAAEGADAIVCLATSSMPITWRLRCGRRVAGSGR
jgi:transcription regulator MmyB-like protein